MQNTFRVLLYLIINIWLLDKMVLTVDSGGREGIVFRR